MKETPIEVMQGDDADASLRLRVRNADRSFSPYVLPSGTTLTCYVKSFLSDEDADALFTLTSAGGSISIDDTGEDASDTHSRITLKFTAAQLAVARTLVYRVVATKSARKQTVARGPLRIIDG